MPAKIAAEKINPCSRAKAINIRIAQLKLLNQSWSKVFRRAQTCCPKCILAISTPQPAMPGNRPITTAGAWCDGVAVKL